MMAVWLLAAAGGTVWLWSYETRPGSVSATPSAWPTDSAIRPAPGRYTLVMAVHPHCPCTRATFGELAMLTTHAGERLQVYVLFTRPSGVPAGWERTDLWDSALRLPGCRPIADERGEEAARFGAATSGHSALYDPDGRLVFRGGITASRGHAGDNPGRAAIERIVLGGERGGVHSLAATPVYGCPLAAEGPCKDGEATCKQ
jgi:hypothetical protein